MNKSLESAANLWVWVFAGLVAVGCQTSYRCETVVSADGKVERAVYQPEERTPDVAKDPTKWKEVRRAPTPSELDNVGWPSSIKQIYSTPPRIGQSYFLAWGSFGSPKEIPDHLIFLQKELPDGPQSRLARVDCHGLCVRRRILLAGNAHRRSHLERDAPGAQGTRRPCNRAVARRVLRVGGRGL